MPTTPRATPGPGTAAAHAGAEAGPSLVIKTRVLDGILTGIASATVAGVLWWAVASNVEFTHWHLGAVLVGLIVGQGVLIGARRGGLVAGILAFTFTAVAVLAAVYFIDRSVTIDSLQAAGRSSDIPLWQGVQQLKDLYKGWYDFDQTKPAEWLLGPIVAAIVAGWPNRRPLVG